MPNTIIIIGIIIIIVGLGLIVLGLSRKPEEPKYIKATKMTSGGLMITGNMPIDFCDNDYEVLTFNEIEYLLPKGSTFKIIPPKK